MEASLSFWFDVKYSKNKRNGTEELVFIDEWSVLSIVLGDHGGNCTSEGLAVDEPKQRVLRSLDGGWSWCRIEQGQFSEAFPRP